MPRLSSASTRHVVPATGILPTSCSCASFATLTYRTAVAPLSSTRRTPEQVRRRSRWGRPSARSSWASAGSLSFPQTGSVAYWIQVEVAGAAVVVARAQGLAEQRLQRPEPLVGIAVEVVVAVSNHLAGLVCRQRLAGRGTERSCRGKPLLAARQEHAAGGEELPPARVDAERGHLSPQRVPERHDRGRPGDDARDRRRTTRSHLDLPLSDPQPPPTRRPAREQEGTRL
jgi:hypothetical protein